MFVPFSCKSFATLVNRSAFYEDKRGEEREATVSLEIVKADAAIISQRLTSPISLS
jgi:hypothetical protein